MCKLYSTQMCFSTTALWLANWLANILWLQKKLAGRNWKMGSPLFSPLSWTKDQLFFPSTDAVARGGAQGVRATEQPPWRIRVGLLCNGSHAVTKEDGRRLKGNVSNLFVLGHFYLCGGHGDGGDWNGFVKYVVAVLWKRSTACVSDVFPPVTAPSGLWPVCRLRRKEQNGYILWWTLLATVKLQDGVAKKVVVKA